MEPETYPVKKTSELIGKRPNTLRTWSGEEYFGPYLSPYANPEPGTERRYTERDIRVLRTAVILQNRGLAIKDIIPRIASGEIIEELPEEFPEEPVPEKGETSGPGKSLLNPRESVGNQIELFIRPFESQIERLSRELESEREAHLSAEKELARLRAILEERDKPWYKRLFRS